ncbi:flagellin [Wenzhouxiangella limi]|uniref:Flagellin n=1 Tax=Wenzhouxiangella limi TaxID=2707351 RepID=A0A845VIW9_9GAMM|nr:flagellin [Wenzhouxiangella limi]NDY97119.1 flagellar protein FlaB [Wenzhouxiangella limi]
MSQVINTNVLSLTAQRNLQTSQSELATSLQRLSSGLRINSAKDDAAGLAISERFTTQIRGLNQAIRNSNDGISLAQTGEAALATVTENLQRVRELAVQSVNATNSDTDRATLQQEVTQRLNEIDRIAGQTSFNGRNVLDGTFGNALFQVGANVGQTIALDLESSVRSSDIGSVATASSVDLTTLINEGTDDTAASFTTGDVSSLVGVDLSSAGTGGSFETDAAITEFDFGANNVTFDVNGEEISLTSDVSTIGGLVTEIQGQLDTAFGAGVVTVTEDTGVLTFTDTLSAEAVVVDNQSAVIANAAFDTGTGSPGTLGTISFEVDGNAITLDGDATDNATLQAIADDIGAQLETAAAGTYSVSVDGSGIAISTVATGSAESAPVISALSGVGAALFDDAAGTSVDGADGDPAAELTTSGLTIQFGDNDAIEVEDNTFTTVQSFVDAVNTALGSNGTALLNADNELTITSGEAITIAGDSENVFDGTTEFAVDTATALADTSVSSVDNANNAIARVDAALSSVSELRSTFGAIQNRFESTIENLTTTTENLQASRSRILDADFAAETANLTRVQILQQAGISVLSQANVQPQNVLALLQ